MKPEGIKSNKRYEGEIVRRTTRTGRKKKVKTTEKLNKARNEKV